ncbi:MAG: TolC family protein [Bacteroidales bacterium]|nr:TolC family protein [Bacteroidales bacterium]
MKKTILIYTMVCACIFTAQAQRKWTLEECIEYAISQNIVIKQTELQKESAEVAVHTAQMNRLPNLNASAGQNWNFGRTQTANGMYENRTQSSNSFSISSSVPLFTGFQIPNQVKKNKLDLKAAVYNMEAAEEDLALNITSLFLQVLFNKEFLKISQERENLSNMQLDRTKSLVNAGKVPHSQLTDIEAQIASDKVSVVEAKNNLILSLLELAQYMELEKPLEFDIYEPEMKNIQIENDFIESPVAILNNALNTKPSIKSSQYRVESAGKSVKIAESGYWPSLTLNLSYGTNYFYLYNSDTNRPFRNQLKNNAGKYIGLSLNIPIFNRFSVRNQVRNAKINYQNQQLILEDTKKNLHKEIQTAYVNASNAREKYLASNKAISASQESFQQAQQRYEVGRSTVFEFNEIKNKLMVSQSEQLRAKYDYIFRIKILDFYNGISITLN